MPNTQWDRRPLSSGRVHADVNGIRNRKQLKRAFRLHNLLPPAPTFGFYDEYFEPKFVHFENIFRTKQRYNYYATDKK